MHLARRWREVLCGAGLAAGIAGSYALAAVTPELLKHHVVLLETLSGGITSIVTAGAFAHVGRVSLLAAVLAPLCTVLIYDVFYWWAGQLWGETVIAKILDRSPPWKRWVGRAERAIRRRGVLVLFVSYYLPIPNAAIDVACGLAEMPLWQFVIGDAVGLVLWEGLLVGLGWAIGHRAVHIVNVVNHYSLWITLGVIVLVVVIAQVRLALQQRRRRALQPPDADLAAAASLPRDHGVSDQIPG
ncbi:MAG TPA: VTT domain-containing protein [Mycobacteriales bacterium]|nr:VTT domain-containing protein [Mycobacteriales bacterium]